jgi:phage-related protein
MLGEAFTILAIAKLTDEMSSKLENIDRSLDKFASTAVKAADTAKIAGASIDESLLQTASGADAEELADAKLNAARTRLTAATDQQAAAERDLLAAQSKIAEDGVADQAVIDAQADAYRRLTIAETETANATKGVSDAEANQAKIAEATAAKTDEAAAAADAGAAAQGRLGRAGAESGGLLGGASKGMTTMALAVAAVGAMSVKAAGDFQSSTQHLVTDAGEAQKNLEMIRQGILNVATSTGTSATSLVDAMYHIESAGFHGAEGLKLLTTAAQGAKVGNADFGTVAKTLTGTMNSYNMTGDQATQMMNGLIAAVGAGDMKMNDLASSLGNVTPLAAAAGLSFAQVSGAIATMTSQNMSADQATQDLANTIRGLQNPNNVAINQMQQLGLNANDVAMNLGKRGLTGTMEMLTAAVAAHTKGGQVLIDTMKNSKAAAADANIMFKQLPASIQGIAKQLMDGSITAAQFNKGISGLDAPGQHLAKQFELLIKNSGSFNDLLKSGKPAAETYNAAMAKMLGGATGLNTALMITGDRMATFQANTNTVAEAMKKGGTSVDNWDKIQGTFNQKMSVLKSTVEVAGISIGTMLLPAVSKFADILIAVIRPTAEWINQHHTLAGLILSVVGGMLAAIMVIKTVIMVQKLWTAAQIALNLAMDANPIGLIIIAVAGLVAGIIYAWTHFKTFRDVVEDVFNWLKDAVVTVIDFVEGHWRMIITIIGGPLGLAVALVTKYWDQITGAAKSVWHALVDTWNAIKNTTLGVWNSIKDFFERYWKIMLFLFATPIYIMLAIWKNFHQDVEDAAHATWNAIKEFLGVIWGGIKSAAGAVWLAIKVTTIRPIQDVIDFITMAWNKISPWLKQRWDEIKGAATATWNAIYSVIIAPIVRLWNDVTSWFNKITSAVKTAWNSAMDFIGTIAGKVWGAFKDAGKWLWDAGVNIIKGLINGIKSAVGDVKNTLVDIGKSIISWKGPPEKDAVLLYDNGQLIMNSLINGITSKSGTLQSQLSAVGKSIEGAFGKQVTANIGLSATGSLSAGAMAYTGSGGGGGQVVNYFDLRQSHVQTDRDMDALVEKIGRRLATRTLAAGGTRIRM